MRKKSFELTKGEETMMELFWSAERPLTSMELCEMTDEFNYSYVHRLLTALQNKGMLEVEGLCKSGKQYARTFIPTITREEYAALVMKQLGIKDEKALAKVAVAMVKTSDNDSEKDKKELVDLLESMVEQLKNS